MSKQLRMGINAISFNDDESKTIQYAVKANVSFTYKVVDEDWLGAVEGTEEADKKVKRLVESNFFGCFMEVLAKKPRAQWPMCGDEITAYVKEKALMHSKGVEIEEFNLQSISDDPEYRKRMEEMQKKMNVGKLVKEEPVAQQTPTTPTQTASNENPNPFANGMDMKRIFTIVVVIILLIVGYFMK